MRIRKIGKGIKIETLPSLLSPYRRHAIVDLVAKMSEGKR
jgi:hypothetical protein